MSSLLQAAVVVLLLTLINTANAVLESSYVWEPFDDSSDRLTVQGPAEASFVSDSYIGNALLLDYTTNNTAITIAVLQDDRPHSCVGATAVSFWVRRQGSSSCTAAPLSLRLVLLDDSECLDCTTTSWDRWTTSSREVVDQQEWQEVRILFEDLQQSNPESEGNRVLDLHRLRGFEIEMDLPTTDTPTSGKIGLDHVACLGGPELLGAAFQSSKNSNTSNFETALQEGQWTMNAYDSPLSHNQSRVVVEGDGALQFDYLVQQSVSWGGFLSYT